MKIKKKLGKQNEKSLVLNIRWRNEQQSSGGGGDDIVVK
jgi:hypothetical protein